MRLDTREAYFVLQKQMEQSVQPSITKEAPEPTDAVNLPCNSMNREGGNFVWVETEADGTLQVPRTLDDGFTELEWPDLAG